jgi:hypothetical protein
VPYSPPRAAEQRADIAKRFGVVEAVEAMAGGDAGLAAGAGIQIDAEGVLFAGAGRCERNQIAVVFGVGVCFQMSCIVQTGEASYCRQRLLLGEHGVDQWWTRRWLDRR